MRRWRPTTLELPAAPWIVGHRGAATEAVGNTLESFLLALKQGAHMVEADLQLTRDATLVAIHDRDLFRLTGSEAQVEDLSVGSLKALVLRGGASCRGATGRIPTLAEVLCALPPDYPLNLELKRRRAPRPEMVHALRRALAGREQVLISSFDWELLAAVRRRCPELPVAPLGADQPQALLEAAKRLGAWSVHAHRRLATRSLIDSAAAAGRPTLVYTVNRLSDAREILRRGAAGLFTDRPGWMMDRLVRR